MASAGKRVTDGKWVKIMYLMASARLPTAGLFSKGPASVEHKRAPRPIPARLKLLASYSLHSLPDFERKPDIPAI